MPIDNLGSLGATIGGGFFAGALIGYALKKVVKVVAIVVGLFFAGLAYLQYQHIVVINWNKVPLDSQNVVATLANAQLRSLVLTAVIQPTKQYQILVFH
jgi:uncharacterized membrane protein (Fun14 family)